MDDKKNDEKLLRRAEAVLAELDRTQGLADEHADLLAALRIRLFGSPRKSLDDILEAAGELKGKASLEDLPPARRRDSLEDAFRRSQTKPQWPGA